MPRCLMAKKWKSVAYEKSQSEAATQTSHHHIHPKKLKFGVSTCGTSATMEQNNNNRNTVNNNSVIKGRKGQWGPQSPTEGTTAPSPPLPPAWLPAPTAGKVTVLFNGYLQDSPPPSNSSSSSNEEPERITASPLPQNEPSTPIARPTSVIRSAPKSHAFPVVSTQCYTINIPQYSYPPTPTTPTSRFHQTHSYPDGCLPPPKKRELYRPYCLPESIEAVQQEKRRLQSVCSSLFERKPEDILGAHAILDLSTSHLNLPPPPPLIAAPIPPTNPTALPPSAPPPPLIPSNAGQNNSCEQQSLTLNYPLATVDTNKQSRQNGSKRSGSPNNKSLAESKKRKKQQSNNNDSSLTPKPVTPSTGTTKTIAYTYETFFMSDGRSKKKQQQLLSASPKENANGRFDISSDSEGDTASLSSSSVHSPAAVGELGISQQKGRYTCNICNKSYATSSNLSRHKQTHRSLDSQSAKRCDTCGKAYVSMPALAMHILTHSLNHKCDVCGKAFSRPWLLQGHMRSHTGEKPYACAHCGKSFADRSNLRAHMQTHSAAKNYECKRCHKSFALKSYLNKHYDSACFKEEIEEGEVSTFRNSSNGNSSSEEDTEDMHIQIDDEVADGEVEVEVEVSSS